MGRSRDLRLARDHDPARQGHGGERPILRQARRRPLSQAQDPRRDAQRPRAVTGARRVLEASWRYAGSLFPSPLRGGARGGGGLGHCSCHKLPPSLALPRKGGGNRPVQTGYMGDRIDRRHGSVSYTHLDVYKRQAGARAPGPADQQCPAVEPARIDAEHHRRQRLDDPDTAQELQLDGVLRRHEQDENEGAELHDQRHPLSHL